MKNPLIQLATIIAVLILAWQGLRQIDWLTLLNIEQTTKNTEQKLGDLLWEFTSETEIELTADSLTKPVVKIVNQICRYNDIDSSEIKIHLVHNHEVNAFAMPDNHLVVFTGLIENCENAEELAGVLGHEIGHLQENHVMKKLMKEIGLSILISLTTGNSGSEILQETLGTLTSKAYDRDLEREADTLSVNYLINSNINPKPFGNFLYRLAQQTNSEYGVLLWMSTHPDSEERAKNVFEYLDGFKHSEKEVIPTADWVLYKSFLKAYLRDS